VAIRYQEAGAYRRGPRRRHGGGDDTLRRRRGARRWDVRGRAGRWVPGSRPVSSALTCGSAWSTTGRSRSSWRC